MTLHYQRGMFVLCTAALAAISLSWAANQLGAKPTVPDVDAIIHNLTSSLSQVLVMVIHGQNLTLIIGPMKGRIIVLESTYVFEQSMDTVDGNFNSIKLMTPKKAKYRWPALIDGPYWKMIGVGDSTDLYIILATGDDVSALNTVTGVINPVVTQGYIIIGLRDYPTLSSGTGLRFFFMDDMTTFVMKSFPSAPPSYLTEIETDDGSVEICNSGPDTVILPEKGCFDPVNWIRTGLLDEKNFVLIDKSNSVVVLPKSAYDIQSGEPVKFQKTTAAQFWTKFQPSPTTNASSPKDHSTVSRGIIRRSPSHSRIITIIVVSLGLAIGIVVLIGLACYCFSSKKATSAFFASGNGKSQKQAKTNSEAKSNVQSSKAKSADRQQFAEQAFGSVLLKYDPKQMNGLVLKQSSTHSRSGTTLRYAGPKKVPRKQSRKAKGKKRSTTKRGRQSTSQGKRSSATRKQ